MSEIVDTGESEIKYFNVKNVSLRLVHIGSVAIPPEQVRPVIDDELGINRRDVELSEYLEETDEDAEEVPVAKPAAKKSSVKKATSATGAGWSAA